MSNWLKKKFQNQFDTRDVTAIALSKLQQMGNLNDPSKSEGKYIQDTSSRCSNCSTVTGPNNTVNVTLRSDLLNYSELGSITTLEEVSRDPGFQEFLAGQLNLYFKFIANSSSNTFLASVKHRTSVIGNGQSCISSVPNSETRICRTSENQSQIGNTTSQKDLGQPLEPIAISALSLIEEENTEQQHCGEECSKNPNPQKGRSVSEDTAESNDLVRSQTSRLHQRLKEKLHPCPAEVPKLSVNNKRVTSLRERSDRSVAKFRATEDAINLSVVDKRTKTRTNSSSSVDETSEQLTRAEGRRSERTFSKDSASQSDNEIFKKPLPPKGKLNPPHSNNKRLASTNADAKEGKSTRAMEEFQDEVPKAPVRKKPSVSGSKESEQRASTYQSRSGRVSKRPGDFWDPLTDRSYSRGSRKTEDLSGVSETEEKIKPTLKPVHEKLDPGIDSESGYSSGRKPARDRRVTRVEPPKKPEGPSGTSKQATGRPHAEVSVKPPVAKGRRVGLAASGDKVEEDEMEAEDEKKPTTKRKGRTQKTEREIENISFQNKEQVEKVASRFERTAARELVKPAGVTKQNASRSVRQAQARGITRNIFSDSNSSASDVSYLASDANQNRGERTVVSMLERNRGWANATAYDRLLIDEESSDDEVKLCALRGREKDDTHRSRQHLKQTRQDRVIVESRSEEEDATVVRAPVAKRKAALKNPPPVESRSEEEDATVVRAPVAKRKATLKNPPPVEISSEEEDATVVRAPVAKRKAALKNPPPVESSSEEEDATVVRARVAKRKVALKNPPPVEISSEEEDATVVRARVAKRKAALKNPPQVESSSEEEDATVVRAPVAKRKAGVKNPPQAAQKKRGNSLVPEKLPTVRQKAQNRPKGRFLFSGSSTDEESICSYQTTDRNRQCADSGSFIDDASYMSVLRSSHEREIRLEGKRRERPRVVSRFRI